MTSFILNNTLIKTELPKGMSLLNFIRNEAGLKGTKGGCKEGDCGACTVLLGELKDEEVKYKTIVSCLTPLGNVHGKHVVTIEGLNMPVTTPVQQQFIDNAATQCGFCTPGFIVSLTGYAISGTAGNEEDAIASIAGNICRCTGYKSIEKAAFGIAEILKDKDSSNPVKWLIDNNFIPEYFDDIKNRLKEIKKLIPVNSQPDLTVGGGTDLMVQMPETVKVSALNLVSDNKKLKTIEVKNNRMVVGGAVTVNDLLDNAFFVNTFPESKEWFKLVSSEQIRNTATLAGNFVNASPIGDMSVFFIALEAEITLVAPDNSKRKLKLKDFFLDYKVLDKKENEIIESIEFELPSEKCSFNFEKVSKRLHLDIASVNSALKIEKQGNVITKAVLSAGGIAPVPKYLRNTSGFLTGKEINSETIREAADYLQKDISPISDVRGSKEYKELLLKQLLFAHFFRIFPDVFKEETLLQLT